jgi:hypothetical protein
MPDLDQLLAADAQRSTASDGAVSAFGPAFDRTLTRMRRRRRQGAVVGAATVVAAAVAGSLIASTTGSAQRSTQRVRLAANYHVIAPVPGHSDDLYVVGPPGGHTPAECRKVPGVSVKLTRVGRMEMARGIRMPGYQDDLAGQIRIQVPRLPSGEYDLFVCPNRVTPSASASAPR